MQPRTITCGVSAKIIERATAFMENLIRTTGQI
jgi:hypothetical protein